MKTQIKLTVLAASIGLSASASANIFNDIGNWISGAVNTTGSWLTGIYETASETGFAGSPRDAEFRIPSAVASASGELKIAAMNIKGFPEALDGISNARTAEFAHSLINGKGYDIIGFQENWVRNDALMNAIDSNQLPWRSDHFRGGATSFGDGLSIASKFPFHNRQIHEKYNDCYGTYAQLIDGSWGSPDCETEKGFTFAEIRVAKDFVVHFYNTHMDTNGSVKQSQFNQLENHIRNRSAGFPVILVGDFNAYIDRNDDAPSPTVKEKWLPASGSIGGRFVGNLGLTWACGQVDSSLGNTNKTHKCGGVDHIAYRGGQGFDFSVVREEEVHQSISDHNPYVITLRWTNNNVSSQKSIPVGLRTYHNAYIASSQGGGADVNQSFRADIAAWERFDMNLHQNNGSDPSCMQHGDMVRVLTQNGHYFRAHNDGNLDAGSPYAMTWETFRLHNHSDHHGCLAHQDNISLLSTHNDYIAAESDGRVTSNRSGIGAWEIFRVDFADYRLPEMRMSLRTHHNSYVMAINNGNADIKQAYISQPNIWETFTMTVVEKAGSDYSCIQNGDKVLIRTGHGNYFIAHSDGRLNSESTNPGSWETFTLVKHSNHNACFTYGDQISLRSTAHNRYVVAESGHDVNANRGGIGAWEVFVLDRPF